ncbi:MAG: hypothetical protein NTZ98_12870 [Acidobacteria bacterium]|nr:hypothetical protein [Acidobacteriota bacterium]
MAFVHDGLHHLPDAYRGVREMLRVCSTAAVIVEPADAPLTRLALKVGLAGDYEEAGNYVYRLRTDKLRRLFSEENVRGSVMRQDLVYYQPWTFRIYRLFARQPMFSLFRLFFYVANVLFGRWGNSLKAVAWKI